LPPIVMDFHAAYPAVRVRVRISDTGATLDAVRHGDFEIGIVGASRQDDDDLLFESFAADELVLAIPATPAWQGRSEITLREMQELALVVREPGSGTRTSLEHALGARKVQLSALNVVAELGSTGAIKEAVKQGQCVSFVSQRAIAAELEAGALRLAHVPELGTIRRTYQTVFSRRRALSPISRAFLDHLRPRAMQPPRRSPSRSSRARD
jgi:DNA-binding transcriptional LysR family regulator